MHTICVNVCMRWDDDDNEEMCDTRWKEMLSFNFLSNNMLYVGIRKCTFLGSHRIVQTYTGTSNEVTATRVKWDFAFWRILFDKLSEISVSPNHLELFACWWSIQLIIRGSIYGTSQVFLQRIQRSNTVEWKTLLRSLHFHSIISQWSKSSKNFRTFSNCSQIAVMHQKHYIRRKPVHIRKGTIDYNFSVFSP